jgi:hypothetical protein
VTRARTKTRALTRPGAQFGAITTGYKLGPLEVCNGRSP